MSWNAEWWRALVKRVNGQMTPMREERPSGIRTKLALICGALTIVVTSLVLVAIVSMEMLSAARGYTQGEALWSKGQKDAILYVTRYAQTRSEADYQRFRAAIQIPLTCRAVRRQMDLPHYNRGTLERLMDEVGIQRPDHVRMISLYRYFGTERHLAGAVNVWKGAEGDIDALERNGEYLHRRMLSHTADPALIEQILSENDRINDELTPLEARFSQSLASASHWLHRVLATAISLLAGILIAAGSAVCYFLLRRIADSEHRLQIARDRALDASNAKSEFLANMSHEIRTPMNGVMGMISLALDRCSDAEQKEQLNVAETAAEALLAIINDILDLSRIEAGKMNVEVIDFDLGEICQQTVRIFESTTKQKSIRLTLSFAAACPVWVRGDPVRVRQVLVNLVGNAVKFTEHGSVDVRVSFNSGSFRFEVEDTGIGIPVEKLEAIFEAFTQADGTHTRKFGGSGLGLTITRRLVSLMNGRIWAESPGQGSCFFVELPLPTLPADFVKPSLPVIADASLGIPNLNVLVAEDNPINQKVICAMLKRFGWSVILAINGREAHQRFLESHFDLVLMDVQMPEVDGFESTRLIRDSEQSGEASHHTPILGLTAHASRPQHDQCLEAGMDDVITKPVTRAALLNMVASVLAKTPTAA